MRVEDIFPMAVADVRGRPRMVFTQRSRSVSELLADAVERFGERELVVSDDVRLTYADVAERSARLAAVLQDRYGVGPGHRVGIAAANHPDWLAAFYAGVHCGAVVAAFNGWWTPVEMAHGVSLAEPTVVIGDRARLERLPAEIAVPLIDLDDLPTLLADATTHAQTPVAEDDPGLILFTSGTTGLAKGALLSHRSMIGFVQVTMANAVARTLEAGLPLAAPAGPTVTLATSPFFHLSGLFASILLGTATGGKLVVRSGRFDAGDVLRLIEQEQVTNWTPLGDMGSRVAEHPDLASFDLSSLRALGLGGAPVSPHLQSRLRRLLPEADLKLAMGYGSSESATTVTSINDDELLMYPSSCGRPVVTVDVELRDPDGRPVPAPERGSSEEGEVHVRSAYTMLGYFRDEAATAASFADDGWLAMGDVGRWVDGFLHLDSRAREFILRNAENVYPVEIEHRLESHPAVREVAVVGTDHPAWGEEVCAVVVLRADAVSDEAALTEELVTFAAGGLAPHKVPTRWVFRREELPRTASGKVQRRLVRGDLGDAQP